MNDERVCRVSPNFPMILGMRLAWGLPLAPSVTTRLPVLVMRLFPLYTGILEPLVRNGSKASRKYPAMCACDSGSASCSFIAMGHLGLRAARPHSPGTATGRNNAELGDRSRLDSSPHDIHDIFKALSSSFSPVLGDYLCATVTCRNVPATRLLLCNKRST